ncbi:MAG TPA: TetR/AcrR family transcriptional regulator, partial [Bacteroidia bacterium]|nr:TetR/AcrR family transcriptional regulator [Bacteroidia bacterium]
MYLRGMRLKDMEKREAIKQATFALVADEGVSALKMADLAKRVGVSPSTLYTYFEDKQHLIQTLFREVMKAMVTLVVKEFHPDRPYKANLKQFWIAYLHYRIRHHKEILFYERVKASSYFQKTVAEVKSMEMMVPMQLIRMGKEQMLIKDLDD